MNSETQTPDYSGITFARLDGTRVLEFPVTHAEIVARGAPMSMFHQVIFDKTPDLLPFHRLESRIEVVNLTPYVRYTLVPLSIQEILNAAWMHNESVSTSEVPKELVERIIDLAYDEVDERLNAFARERKYLNIDTLATYYDDEDEVLKKEGQLGKRLRSAWYSNLRKKAKEFADGAPLPRIDTEIFASAPALVWED